MSVPKKREPVWMVVASTGGMPEAEIIAGRLRSLNIPAIVQREALSAVLPLTFGLGQADVAVPEQFYEAAMMILYPDEEPYWLEDGEDEDDEQFDE